MTVGTPPRRVSCISLNEEIYRDNDSCMFVTMFCGILDVQTGRVEFSNAGHNLPYVLSNGTVTALTNPGGWPWGWRTPPTFGPGTSCSAPETVWYCTRTVSRTLWTRVKKFFSQARLETTLHGGQSSKAVVEEVVSEVRHFCAGAPQSDDITLLVLGYMGPKEAERSTVSFQLRNDLSEVQRLSQIVTDFAAQHDLAPELVSRVNLVLEEIVTNVISIWIR